jgi:hypothetical protein
MSRESFGLQVIKKPENPKDILGQQFKKLLQEKAQYYDKELMRVIEEMAGEEFAKANRNIAVLKSALREFIKIPDFPKEEAEKITANIAELEQADPLPDRMNYSNTEELNKKNYYALLHNNGFAEYKSSIMKLLFGLKNVLPENMYQDLLSRNGMFAGLLNWVDRSQS